jgi:hypothetical protein
MKINRRDLLFGSALSLVAGTRAIGQTNTAATTGAQPSVPPAAARLLAALQRNRLSLTLGDTPAGSGWDWLVREAGPARFTLIGEEHGVAETAQFSAALWLALRGSGYSRMAVELSPPIAIDLETAARRNGLKGIVDVLNSPGAFTFYNLREEAKFLADVINAAPKERVLWGLDREIFSDRYLISRLETRVPQRARDAFERLKKGSTNAWAKFEKTRNPDDMFILAEEPGLVSAVRAKWPKPDRESETIMRTHEESLAIETAERTGGRWPYFQSRSQWMRSNLSGLLRADQGRKVPPKIMMKFGYSHAIRGANYLNVFDIGSMADEAAALTGDSAFHIIVLPSPGSRQAVPGQGRSFGSVATNDYDDLQAGDGRLTRVLSNPNAKGHEVINLRALRPIAMRGLEGWNPDVVRTIYGYDAAVIWKGAHASTDLGI